MIIDIDKLRDDLREEEYGAFFGGGYPGAIMEALEIDSASDDELIKIAERNGFDLSDYEIDE